MLLGDVPPGRASIKPPNNKSSPAKATPPGNHHFQALAMSNSCGTNNPSSNTTSAINKGVHWGVRPTKVWWITGVTKISDGTAVAVRTSVLRMPCVLYFSGATNIHDTPIRLKQRGH